MVQGLFSLSLTLSVSGELAVWPLVGWNPCITLVEQSIIYLLTVARQISCFVNFYLVG